MEITRHWVRRTFGSLLAAGHDLDDLLQEARIAGLKTPERPHVAARSRLINISRGRRYTGSENGRIPNVRPEDLEPLESEHDRADVQEDLSVRVDVRRAVQGLPAGYRRIVWLRCWEGKRFEDIAREVGVSKTQILKRWQGEILPHLREELTDAA